MTRSQSRSQQQQALSRSGQHSERLRYNGSCLLGNSNVAGASQHASHSRTCRSKSYRSNCDEGSGLIHLSKDGASYQRNSVSYPMAPLPRLNGHSGSEFSSSNVKEKGGEQSWSRLIPLGENPLHVGPQYPTRRTESSVSHRAPPPALHNGHSGTEYSASNAKEKSGHSRPGSCLMHLGENLCLEQYRVGPQYSSLLTEPSVSQALAPLALPNGHFGPESRLTEQMASDSFRNSRSAPADHSSRHAYLHSSYRGLNNPDDSTAYIPSFSDYSQDNSSSSSRYPERAAEKRKEASLCTGSSLGKTAK